MHLHKKIPRVHENQKEVQNLMKESVKLTQFAKSAGCAAKIGPKVLAEIVGELPKFFDEHLLVGTETNDDGAVYQISDELALIQTLDFFPPVVDEPSLFGEIAAANALSDIYAMGGTPKIALNIVAFPNCLGQEVLGEILQGGAKKVQEAGAVLAGGHSINDEEPKYGLSVTGFVNPKKMWKNSGAGPGDALILTKPIGTGLVNTAAKADMVSETSRKLAIGQMRCLNYYASEILKDYEVHGCTDVTGFSLAGHALEMAEGSQVTIKIDTKKIPFLPDVEEYAKMGLVPEGTYRNKEFLREKIKLNDTIKESFEDLLFDPQTSGGLLVSLKKKDAKEVLKRLQEQEQTRYSKIVGEVEEKQEVHLIFL